MLGLGLGIGLGIGEELFGFDLGILTSATAGVDPVAVSAFPNSCGYTDSVGDRSGRVRVRVRVRVLFRIRG